MLHDPIHVTWDDARIREDMAISSEGFVPKVFGILTNSFWLFWWTSERNNWLTFDQQQSSHFYLFEDKFNWSISKLIIVKRSSSNKYIPSYNSKIFHCDFCARLEQLEILYTRLMKHIVGSYLSSIDWFSPKSVELWHKIDHKRPFSCYYCRCLTHFSNIST